MIYFAHVVVVVVAVVVLTVAVVVAVVAVYHSLALAGDLAWLLRGMHGLDLDGMWSNPVLQHLPYRIISLLSVMRDKLPYCGVRACVLTGGTLR